MIKDVISVEYYNIVQDVLIIMQEYRHMNLPVVNSEGYLIGTVSALDIMGLVGMEKISPYESALISLEAPGDFVFEDLQAVKNKYIGEFMNTDAKFVYEDDNISHIMSILLAQKLVSIPVVDGSGKLIGMLDSIEMLRKMLNYSEEKNKD